MSPGLRLLAVLFALLALLAPAPLFAADAGRESEARALFERAAERLRAGQFAEARDLLNQSLALASKPATAFNLSVAYRGTGESMRAAELLRRLRGGELGELEPEQRKEVLALLRAVEAEIGTLEVRRAAPPTSRSASTAGTSETSPKAHVACSRAMRAIG